MLKLFGLLVLMSLSYSFECNEEGYEAYLEKYEFKVEAEGNYTQTQLVNYLTRCKSLIEKKKTCGFADGLERYRFTPNTPSHPTAGGLMNLLANDKRPAFVMMAIDLKKLVYVKDMSDIKDSIKCAGYQPSLYGVVTGNKYYPNSQSGWWEVVTHIVPSEEVTVKIPITSNMANANYAGIAAYAFTLSEVMQPDWGQDVVISDNTNTTQLFDKHAKSITIGENLFNEMTEDLDISTYRFLESIELKDKLLKKVKSVKLSSIVSVILLV